MRGSRLLALVLLGASVAATTPASGLEPATPAVEAPAVLIGAGDIAGPWLGDDDTAKILDRYPDATVFTAGDNSYALGSYAEYLAFYELSWGRHKARTRPAAGNHDYETAGGGNGGGYRQYFGAATGTPGGWYSYEAGAWHVVVLNGECDKVGGCGAGSPQSQWLQADLAAHPTRCTMAVFHYPRFNSGGKGETQGKARGDHFWRVLHTAGTEIVVSGDEHVYERFAPQTPDGVLDRNEGTRQFTVGTGGALPGSFAATPRPNSEARIAGTYGVLKLELSKQGYAWEYLAVPGSTATDKGSAECHGTEETATGDQA